MFYTCNHDHECYYKYFTVEMFFQPIQLKIQINFAVIKLKVKFGFFYFIVSFEAFAQSYQSLRKRLLLLLLLLLLLFKNRKKEIKLKRLYYYNTRSSGSIKTNNFH